MSSYLYFLMSCVVLSLLIVSIPQQNPEWMFNLAVYWYWLCVGMNTLMLGLLGLCIILIIATHTWTEENEKSLQRLLCHSLWDHVLLYISRSTRIAAVIFLVAYGHMWIAGFYGGTTVAVWLLTSATIAGMKMNKRLFEKKTKDGGDAFDDIMDDLEGTR